MRILLLLAASFAFAADPKTEILYPEGTPGAAGQEDVDKPTLSMYLADPRKAAGAGVVVCPGGSYRGLAMVHEGSQVAEYFNALGISAFVLKYRLGPRYRHPAPLQDVQRAIRYVRSRSAEFKIQPDRIGVMGYPAGGPLAPPAATHFDAGNRSASAAVDRHSSRPDFAILAYSVLSLTTEYTHRGSKRNLLGEPADEKLAEELSNEKHVTAQTPPTFLFHTD